MDPPAPKKIKQQLEPLFMILALQKITTTTTSRGLGPFWTPRFLPVEEDGRTFQLECLQKKTFPKNPGLLFSERDYYTPEILF